MRGTGKTYRLVLEGLRRASAGQRILVVSENFRLVKHNFNMAMHLAHGFAERFSVPQHIIHFTGGGALRFVTKDFETRGLDKDVQQILDYDI